VIVRVIATLILNQPLQIYVQPNRISFIITGDASYLNFCILSEIKYQRVVVLEGCFRLRSLLKNIMLHRYSLAKCTDLTLIII
jgi:hypothetical protein